MATIHICDKCGEVTSNIRYTLSLIKSTGSANWIEEANRISLCHECYEELMSDFDIIKRNTPNVEVKVVS